MRDNGQRPVLFADSVGVSYVEQVREARRRDLGMYLTPQPVAEFMAGMLHPPDNEDPVRLVDPAAGAGILLCAAVEHLLQQRTRPCRIEVTGYEIDPLLCGHLAGVLDHLARWARLRGAQVVPRVVAQDFLLRHGGLLDREAQGEDLCDILIANPPYFKIRRADERAVAAAAVVHGQPNIYGLFMAVGTALLRKGGQLLCITPRSFASGSYFRALRQWLFDRLRPLRIHVFGSRKDAFRRDDVLQENVILHGQRTDRPVPTGPTQDRVLLSASEGGADLLASPMRSVPLSDVLTDTRVLRLLASEGEGALLRRVESFSGSLAAYGLAISTGPVVPFRAADLIAAEGAVPETHVPLLWMNHVTPMCVCWPRRKKREYIRVAAAQRSLLVPDRNYVLVRRFSAKEEKRRLVAAPHLGGRLGSPLLGLENHLNYVHRPGGELSADEAFGLAALLCSSLLDGYFRTTSGNTQVNATEVRLMPLPAHAAIVAIGQRVARAGLDLAQIDALVDEMV